MQLHRQQQRLKAADAAQRRRPFPTINDIMDARTRLTTSKAAGPFDDMVAEMLKLLCPTLVYAIAYQFAKRIRSPEHSAHMPWAKFAILF